MATDVDVRVISNFSLLSEASVASVLDSPTADSVRALLKAIEQNAKECEQSKSQRVKLEVELETVVRTNESKVKVLQNSRDKALADVQTLRSELQAAETNRLKAEADLEQWRTTSQSEAAELTSLRSRISSLEASNRDTLALLDSKTNAYDKLSEDLSSQHHKAVDLRKQINCLEQSVQAANSSASSFKFKELSLQQEIDLLKKNNEWLETERNIKTEEHAGFRKEKNGRIAELSRSNEQHISEVEALKRSEAALRRRLEEQENRNEDLLQDIQKLQEEKIAEADSARTEIESIKRLQELQQASAEMAKNRVEELNGLLQEKEDQFASQLGAIRAAAENDHADKQAAEKKISELEATVSDLRSELDRARLQPGSPHQPTNSNGLSTPARPSTPLGIFSPSSASRLRGNISTTQLYSEYKKLEKDLATEKRRKEELQESLEDIVQKLEAHKPELEQVQADSARAQGELLEMSELVEKANQERDLSVKEARAYRGQLDAKTKEVELLTQQLRDMSAEIRYLLMEQEIQRRGESLTKEDFEQMKQYADEAMQQATVDLSQTQRIINERLLIFKNISELQQQNEAQVTTIRNLVKKLEDSQAEELQQQHSDTEHELQDARARIVSLEDEIKNLMNQSKSFVKERNMFREMLSRKGRLVEPSDFSRSLPIPAPGSPTPSANESVHAVSAEFKEAFNSLQQQFDAYRQENSATQTTLRQQIEGLHKRNSELQSEISRAQGQLIAASQRNDMLQANLDLIKAENSELTKRTFTLMENGTKQEMRAQQVAEEVVEARSSIESLRRESANLKAEKDLWKNVEKRLIEDNESLRNERSRVDQMNNNLQNLLNEREQADSETRRRLQSQVESLETELQTAKRKLNEEEEDYRKTSLRREYEQEQSQKKIDDLFTSLGSVREELASAKTGRDHLEARVSELTVELRSAEERIEVLNRPTEATNESAGDSVSAEQALGLQVSELKRDIELKDAEIERLNEQIEVYKGISQSSEERLQELSETNDQYREETNTELAEKDAKIKDLEQRIEDISAELNSTNSALSNLRDQQSESARRLDEQKAILEAEIARLKEQEQRYAEQAQFNLETTKEQARIAIEAQQNYEKEVVKHGEAAKVLQTVRTEANQLRLEVVGLRSQAESTQASLQQKESSWADMKDRYEREITDLKKRREEVQQQNSLLHGQLEKLSQQISSLQQDRAALAEGDVADDSAGGLDNLQEVIKYLRREKEIVDMQLHLSSQEAKRLRQQLDFTKTRLDETQLKLDQQRIVEIDSERSATSHQKLMETLNELNLFRESSVTLRAEAKEARQGLAAKATRVEELESQIQPLLAKVGELEHLAELRDGEVKILQNDRDQWQQRTENILSKYNRVDPAELEAMKGQLDSLQTERDAAVAARDSLQAQVDGIPDQVKMAQSELRERLQEQFKAKVRELNSKIKEKQAELDEVSRQRQEVSTELDFVKEQLESARNHQPSSTTQVNGDSARPSGEASGESFERIAELESRISALESALSQKEQELSALQAERKAKEDELKGILNRRLAEVKKEAESAKQAALDEQEQRLVTQHQQELEALRAQSIPVANDVRKLSEAETSEPASATSPVEVSDEMLINMGEERAKFAVQRNAFINRMVTNNIRKRTERLQQQIEELKAAAPAGEASDDQTAEKIQELEQQLISARAEAEQEKQSALADQKQTIEEDFSKRFAQQKVEFDEEAAKKIAQQVASAELMAEKKGQLKLNMAQNGLRKANAQLDVVKRAAEEAPERGVGEVWEEAKIAKPALAPAVQPPKPTVPAKTEQPANSNSPATLARPTPESKEPATVETNEAQTQIEQQQQVQATPVNGPGKSAATPAPTPTPSGLRQPSSGHPRGGASSGIPRGGGRGGGQIAPGRGGSHTGIPRGALSSARGRGSGQGRGSMQLTNVPGGAGGGRGGSISGRSSLSGGAQPFVPGGVGAKRGRDDGDGNGDVGKRIRGGGVGS
ncbi:hypothetical protein DV736_g5540, partial [Chaetothyriales sp. CBS 134916]